MIVHRRITAEDTLDPDRVGHVLEYSLNKGERIIREIHDNLMDVGMSQGQALRLIMGGMVDPALRNSPLMDAQDPEFLMLLAD